MSAHKDKLKQCDLSPPKERAVNCLLARGNFTAAAIAAGKDRTTVHRWFKSDPTFQAAYASARQEQRDEMKACRLSLAYHSLSTLTAAAMNGDTRTSLAVAKEMDLFSNECDLDTTGNGVQETLGGKNSASPKPVQSLKTAADLVAFLSETINQVNRGDIDTKLGSTIGYLASILLKTIEGEIIEKRISDLEQVIQGKSEDSASAFNTTPFAERALKLTAQLGEEQ